MVLSLHSGKLTARWLENGAPDGVDVFPDLKMVIFQPAMLVYQRVHSGRLTWNLQITHLERKMIFQTSMIMFHVNLPGCKLFGFRMASNIPIDTPPVSDPPARPQFRCEPS